MSLILTDTARRPGVLLVTLNRPERHNALSKPLLAELAQALDAARDDSSIHCVVVTGAGERTFSAGADIREQEGFTGTDEASLVEHLGEDVHVVLGSDRNIKITRPSDMALARLFYEEELEAAASETTAAR